MAHMPPVARGQRVAEIKRVHVEGQAAELGAPNPYNGQMVLAAVWLAGYRKMIEDKMASSRARQAYLRRRHWLNQRMSAGHTSTPRMRAAGCR